MSEETKSLAGNSKAGGRRFLYIANPNPGSDDSGEDGPLKSSQKEGCYPQPGSSYIYQPPPLPKPSSSPPRPPKPNLPQSHPPMLTTNFPPDPANRFQYSRSNPTSSSPSSTSSPAVESTPPPSTPGLAGPALDLPRESHREPFIEPSLNEPDNYQHSRSTGFLGKILNRERGSNVPKVVPHKPYPDSIVCLHMCRTNPQANIMTLQSPTSSTPDSYTSPTTSYNSRSSSIEKLVIMVTTDADQYLTVEIISPRNGAVLRERIFTKVCLSSAFVHVYNFLTHLLASHF